MDLEKMQRLSLGMRKNLKGVDNIDSEISAEEADTLNRLGVSCYNDGDHAKANEYFLKAAKAGNAGAMRNLAYNYQTGKGIHEDQQEAFHWFKNAAKLGNVDAMVETCVYYWRGNVTPQDPVKAFSWCKKAAENGHVNAMSWTGEFYRDGNGVMQDINKALEWFQKAYAKGQSSAPKHIGDIYYNGTSGIPVNYQTAIEWYKKAAELGNASAMFDICVIYWQGKVVEKDPVKAFSWCKKAAKNGHVNAMSWTGEFYRDGNGVMQDINKALEWFQKAYAKGHHIAPKEIGDIYYNGTGGVPVNYQTAIEWYQKAAELGNADAMDALGSEYIMGKIFVQDLNQAKMWFQKAIQADPNSDPNKKEYRQKMLEIIEDGLKPSSSGPCFITTAVCGSFGKPDDCYELTAFRNFRDGWLALQSDGKSLIDEYYNIAPKIVAKINSLADSAEIYKNLWRDYLSACLKSIEVGDNFTCKKIYVDMVTTLKEKFLQ